MRPSPHAGHFSTHSEIGKPELAEFIPSLLCLGCDPDEGRESRRASHSGLPRGMRCRTGSVQFDLWSSTASQSSALQRQPATGWPVEWRAERRHAQVMAQGKERRQHPLVAACHSPGGHFYALFRLALLPATTPPRLEKEGPYGSLRTRLRRMQRSSSSKYLLNSLFTRPSYRPRYHFDVGG